MFPVPAGPPSPAARIRPSQCRVSEPWVHCKLPERILLVELSEASCVIAVLQILLGTCVDVSVCERMGSLLSVLPGHLGLPPTSVCTLRGVGGQTNPLLAEASCKRLVCSLRCHTRAVPRLALCTSSSGNTDTYITAGFPARAAKGKAGAAGCLWMLQNSSCFPPPAITPRLLRLLTTRGILHHATCHHTKTSEAPYDRWDKETEAQEA